MPVNRGRETKRNEWETVERWMRGWDFAVWQNWKCVGGERGREGRMVQELSNRAVVCQSFFFFLHYLVSQRTKCKWWPPLTFDLWKGLASQNWPHYTRHEVRNEIFSFFPKGLISSLNYWVWKHDVCAFVCLCVRTVRQTCLSA